MIEIPLYRAKLIDKDEYIIGSFIMLTDVKFILH